MSPFPLFFEPLQFVQCLNEKVLYLLCVIKAMNIDCTVTHAKRCGHFMPAPFIYHYVILLF